MPLHLHVDESLHARIYAWAYRLLRNHDDALDATQDVLLKWVGRDGDTPEQPYAWLRRTTINHCIDQLRRRRPVLDPAGEPALAAASPKTPADDPELRERVVGGLAELSEQQRAVLTAKIYDDETFAAIAQSMGISISSAKTHYLRALRALRDRLGDWKEDAP